MPCIGMPSVNGKIELTSVPSRNICDFTPVSRSNESCGEAVNKQDLSQPQEGKLQVFKYQVQRLRRRNDVSRPRQALVCS